MGGSNSSSLPRPLPRQSFLTHHPPPILCPLQWPLLHKPDTGPCGQLRFSKDAMLV